MSGERRMSQLWSPTTSQPTSPIFPTNAEAHRRQGSMSSMVAPSPRIKYAGKRIAQIVKLKPEFLAEYKACHAAVWPEVLKQIKDCRIEDYSIWYDDLSSTLFASFKYVGYDWEGDMVKMSDNPKVREWWKMTDSYQESYVPGAISSEAGVPAWWKGLEQVFYFEG